MLIFLIAAQDKLMSYTTLQAMTYVLYKYAFILNLALSYKKKNWIYVFFTFLKVQPRYPNLIPNYFPVSISLIPKKNVI